MRHIHPGRRPDWFPLLDEEQAVTLEAIETMTTSEELRTAWLKVQEAELSAVERAALNSAIWARASDLNISTWDFQPYDGGMMSQAAEAMQDAMVPGSALVAILDDTPGKPLRVRFKASEANVVSLNKRVYLLPVLTDAVNRAAVRARAHQLAFGEDGHPPMDVTDAQGRKRYRRTRARAVLQPEHVFMQGTEVFLDAIVLEDTAPGKDMAADIRARRPVYISTRAYGADQRVAQLADGQEVAAPMHMDLETWDRVRNPAFPDAQPIAMLDSVQVQAILDRATVTDPSKTHTAAHKEEFQVKLTLAVITALKATPEGRKELLAALTDAVHPLDPVTRGLVTAALADPVSGSVIDPNAVQQAVTDALNRANEVARQAQEKVAQEKAAAAAYVKEEVQKLREGNRFPVAILDGFEDELKDCPTRDAAEVLLRQQIRLADGMAARGHLAGLGFPGAPGQATVHHIQVGAAQPYRSITDNLVKAFDDWRFQATGERVDPELRKANKPFVDRLLAAFDARNYKALVDSAGTWDRLTDEITAADLYTQATIQRAILEQAFGDMDMLQYLFTDVFEGTTLRVPVEYFDAPRSVELDTAGMASIAEGQIKTTWLSFSPVPRRVRIEVENDTQNAMASGPLRYNAAARALYHISALIRRVMNKAAGNEMLRASDAYGAVEVENEVVEVAECAAVADAGNTAFKITLRRGGDTGALTATNTDRPVVRPRRYKSIADNGAVSDVTEHTITVTLDSAELTEGYLYTEGGINYVVDAAGTNLSNAFAVDYENGYVYISDGSAMDIGATPVVPTIDYWYATNFTTFSLTVSEGYTEAQYFTLLLHLVDKQKAVMASSPRYLAPNFALGSLTAMTYAQLADIFYQQASPRGTVLTPGTQTYMGSRNGVDYAQHNTSWQAGDRRILLGRVGATKYAVRDPLRPEGPFASYDANRKVIAARQWFAEEHSALLTPEVKNQAGTTLNPYYRTIILKS